VGHEFVDNFLLRCRRRRSRNVAILSFVFILQVSFFVFVGPHLAEVTHDSQDQGMKVDEISVGVGLLPVDAGSDEGWGLAFAAAVPHLDFRCAQDKNLDDLLDLLIRQLREVEPGVGLLHGQDFNGTLVERPDRIDQVVRTFVR